VDQPRGDGALELHEHEELELLEGVGIERHDRTIRVWRCRR
jgi:hypothetical protein